MNIGEITKEEVLEVISNKFLEEHSSDIYERVYKDLAEDVKQKISEQMTGQIDKFLSSELEKIVNIEISPVDIFGEKTGAPTTIRAALVEKAKDYWSTKVDKDGKSSNYYNSKSRAEWITEKHMTESFEKAIKENIESIIAGFKKAVKEDLAKKIEEHVNRFIK